MRWSPYTDGARQVVTIAQLVQRGCTKARTGAAERVGGATMPGLPISDRVAAKLIYIEGGGFTRRPHWAPWLLDDEVAAVNDCLCRNRTSATRTSLAKTRGS